MDFKMVHNNFNVTDLEKSIVFYDEALGLKETKRIESDDFTIVYLGDGISGHLLELTYIKEHIQRYDLGENEFHLAFVTDDFDEALIKHKQMKCVCFENTDMGVYFIVDPDGYWLEIIPM